MIPVKGRKLFLTCDDASDPNLSALAPPHPVDIAAPNLDDDHAVRTAGRCHPFHDNFLENFRQDGMRHHENGTTREPGAGMDANRHAAGDEPDDEVFGPVEDGEEVFEWIDDTDTDIGAEQDFEAARQPTPTFRERLAALRAD